MHYVLSLQLCLKTIVNEVIMFKTIYANKVPSMLSGLDNIEMTWSGLLSLAIEYCKGPS